MSQQEGSRKRAAESEPEVAAPRNVMPKFEFPASWPTPGSTTANGAPTMPQFNFSPALFSFAPPVSASAPPAATKEGSSASTVNIPAGLGVAPQPPTVAGGFQFTFPVVPPAAKKASGDGDEGSGDEGEVYGSVAGTGADSAEALEAEEPTGPMKVGEPPKMAETFTTGEEQDENLFKLKKAKVYQLVGGEWKDKGIGQLRINKMPDGRNRVIMRPEGGQRLLLNSPLFPTMSIKRQNDKAVLIGAFTDDPTPVPASFLLKVERKEDGDDLVAALEKHKTAVATTPKKAAAEGEAAATATTTTTTETTTTTAATNGTPSKPAETTTAGTPSKTTESTTPAKQQTPQQQGNSGSPDGGGAAAPAGPSGGADESADKTAAAATSQ